MLGRLSGSISIETAAAIYAVNSLQKVFSSTLATGIDFNAKLASSTIGLETGLKNNSKAAQALLKDIRAFADVSQFEFVDVTPQVQRLQAMGIAGKQLKTTLYGIGEQVAALGKGAETFAGISLQLGQMATIGKVLGRDIRDLNTRGVPAVQYLAKAWGVSTAEMQKLISKGMIPGKQAAQALAEQMQANNFGTMQRQAFELTGALSTLRDNFRFLVAGELKDTYSSVTDIINRLNILARDKEVTTWLHGMARDFRSGFSFAVDILKWFGGAFKSVWNEFGAGLNWSVGALKKWGGFVWDQYKGVAKAAAWMVDKVTWLMQRGLGGAGDFFSKGLEKSLGTVEGQFSKSVGTITGFTGQIAQAWNDTFGAMPDFDSKWDAAGKKWVAARDALSTKPKTTDFSGQFLDGKAGDKAKRDALAAEKDQLNDLATAYDRKAKAVIAAAKLEIQSLTGLRDTLRGTFGDLQWQFVALGVISNPLGAEIAAFEKLLDLGGRSEQIVARARRSFDSLSGTANAAREKRERISGLDGVVPSSSGQLISGQIIGGSASGLEIARAAQKMQSRAGEFVRGCDRLADTTVRSVTTAFNRIMGPRPGDTAARTMARFMAAGIGGKPNGSYAPGDIVYSGATKKNSAGHVQIIGENGNFLDQYGSHARPTTRPQWVVRPGGSAAAAGARGQRAPNALEGALSRDALKNGASPFDLQGIDGTWTTIEAISSAWGKAVKNTGDNSARFAIQSQLATSQFQTYLRETAAETGKSAPQIIAWLRQLSNAADFKLAGVRAVDEVTGALRELQKQTRAVGKDKNPFAGILVEFEPGGKFAAATNQVRELRSQADALKQNPFVAAPGAARALDAQATQLARQKITLLDVQAALSVAQLSQATREATRADRERIGILSRAAPALSALTIGTDKYERAVERAGLTFATWKDEQIAGLLKTAQTYDELGGKALKTAAALMAAPGVAAPGAAKAAQAEGEGLKGRAAAVRRRANEEAGARINAQLSGAEFERGEAKRKAALQTSFELDNQIKLLKSAGEILGDLSLSESQRTAGIERQNFILSKQAELINTGTNSNRALELATGYADKTDEIKQLTQRNERISTYNSLLESSARAVQLAQGKSRIALQFPSFSPDAERQLAIFEKSQAVLAEIEGRGATPEDFDAGGNLKALQAFIAQFDADAGLKNAQAFAGIMGEARQATALFGDTSATAGIKFQTAFGQFSKWPDAWKKSAIEATADIQRIADATAALDGARSQSFDLQKQLDGERISRASRRGSLTASQSQELEWKYSDAEAAAKNPEARRSASESAQIEAQRDRVRALMNQIDSGAKFDRLIDKTRSAFDTLWNDVMSGQKSALDSMGGLLKTSLQDWAREILQSQFKSALLSLFGGGLGAKTPLSVPFGGAMPVSSGGIADGLKASRGGLKFGDSFAAGIDRVPFDALVKVHGGEKILSRVQAEDERRDRAARFGASSSGSGQTVVNVTNITHTGDIRTDSPGDYRHQMEREQSQRRGPNLSKSEWERKVAIGAIKGRRWL